MLMKVLGKHTFDECFKSVNKGFEAKWMKNMY